MRTFKFVLNYIWKQSNVKAKRIIKQVDNETKEVVVELKSDTPVVWNIVYSSSTRFSTVRIMQDKETSTSYGFEVSNELKEYVDHWFTDGDIKTIDNWFWGLQVLAGYDDVYNFVVQNDFQRLSSEVKTYLEDVLKILQTRNRILPVPQHRVKQTVLDDMFHKQSPDDVRKALTAWIDVSKGKTSDDVRELPLIGSVTRLHAAMEKEAKHVSDADTGKLFLQALNQFVHNAQQGDVQNVDSVKVVITGTSGAKYKISYTFTPYFCLHCETGSQTLTYFPPLSVKQHVQHHFELNIPRFEENTIRSWCRQLRHLLGQSPLAPMLRKEWIGSIELQKVLAWVNGLQYCNTLYPRASLSDGDAINTMQTLSLREIHDELESLQDIDYKMRNYKTTQEVHSMAALLAQPTHENIYNVLIYADLLQRNDSIPGDVISSPILQLVFNWRVQSDLKKGFPGTVIQLIPWLNTLASQISFRVQFRVKHYILQNRTQHALDQLSSLVLQSECERLKAMAPQLGLTSDTTAIDSIQRILSQWQVRKNLWQLCSVSLSSTVFVDMTWKTLPQFAAAVHKLESLHMDLQHHLQTTFHDTSDAKYMNCLILPFHALIRLKPETVRTWLTVVQQSTLVEPYIQAMCTCQDIYRQLCLQYICDVLRDAPKNKLYKIKNSNIEVTRKEDTVTDVWTLEYYPDTRTLKCYHVQIIDSTRNDTIRDNSPPRTAEFSAQDRYAVTVIDSVCHELTSLVFRDRTVPALELYYQCMMAWGYVPAIIPVLKASAVVQYLSEHVPTLHQHVAVWKAVYEEHKRDYKGTVNNEAALSALLHLYHEHPQLHVQSLLAAVRRSDPSAAEGSVVSVDVSSASVVSVDVSSTSDADDYCETSKK